MKITNMKNLNHLLKTRVNFLNYSRFSLTTKTHLQQILERDYLILEKLRNGSNFSKDEMSEFARVLNKNLYQPELWQKFEKELPNHINNLDQLEIRKVISLVLSKNNHDSLQSEDILKSLSKRLDLIYTEKDRNGKSLDEFKLEKRFYWNSLPLAYRFYMKLHVIKCNLMCLFKNYGISSK